MPENRRRPTVARYRFKGSEPHAVPVLGRTVNPREVVEIPDDVVKQYVWPEDLWSEVEAAPKSAKADEAAKSAKDGE